MHFGAWERELSPSERNALRFYQGAGYRRINQRLTEPDFVPASREETSKLRQHIRSLDKAISSGWLPEGLTLFRGFGSRELAEFFDATPAALIGAELGSAAFVSTSMVRPAAIEFYKRAGEDALLLEILAPTLTPAAYLAIVTGIRAWEYELLLARGTMFVVQDAKIVSGIRTLVVEISP